MGALEFKDLHDYKITAAVWVYSPNAVAIVFEFNPFEYMGTNASVSGKVS